MNAPPNDLRLLPMLAVLRVGGRDAASFLQGQLTNDVRLLEDGRTQLAACNTPQGRVIALLRLRQVGDTINALLPAELAEPLAMRLRKFVLRAKVDLQVAPELQVAWVSIEREMEANPSGVVFDYAPGRQVVAATAEVLSSTGGAPLAARPGIWREWLAADIACGLPQVVAATSQTFVPQMLNLDLLDAISFSKGCYTGQEIVARTQHLGRIKRRTFRYRLAAGPEPAPLDALLRDGNKVAEVVMSATVDDGVELLAVTSLEARDARLSVEDGRVAEPRPMPYRVADSD